MAKISAHGARVVARLTHATRPERVITSDGRVLLRYTYSDGSVSGYTVGSRGVVGAALERYIAACRRAGYVLH